MGIMLTACNCNPMRLDTSPTLPSGVAGASDRSIVALQKRFNSNGIRVLTIGQDYLISIPTAVIFPNQSPQLTWGSYALLNDVVCYLNEFHKIGVTVSAYTTKYVSNTREHALTLARARAVGNYLWSQGIDSRFIFTEGIGSDKPIIAFAHRGDNSHNSRIEITFRNAVA